MATYYGGSAEVRPKTALAWTGVVLAALGGLIAFILVVILAVGAFSRWQARANAHNAVSVTHIRIQQASQQAQINYAQIAATIAEAQKRYQESVGIRRAQDEISKTLTPLYVQHEAIQAELAIAQSGHNATVIYVPSGQGGVPIITPAGAGK